MVTSLYDFMFQSLRDMFKVLVGINAYGKPLPRNLLIVWGLDALESFQKDINMFEWWKQKRWQGLKTMPPLFPES